MAADFEMANEYMRLVCKRTGLNPEEIVCPMEMSEMTPCIARDGGIALAEGGSKGYCAGCDRSLSVLIKKEREKHKPTGE